MAESPNLQPLHPAMMGEVEPNYELLADAIFRAEGGAKAKSPYGVLSVKVKDADEARRVTINSARNNFKRWVQAGRPGTYVDFFANRWTPPTADPKGNINWKKNVPSIYATLAAPPSPAPVAVPYAVTNVPKYGLPKTR